MVVVSRRTQATDSLVESISKDMKASAQVCARFEEKVCRGQDAQNTTLKRIDRNLTACTMEMRNQSNVLLDVQHQIKA